MRRRRCTTPSTLAQRRACMRPQLRAWRAQRTQMVGPRPLPTLCTQTDAQPRQWPEARAQVPAQLHTAAPMCLGPPQRRAAQRTSWQPARGCCRPARARFRTRCDMGAPRALTLRLARPLVQGFCRPGARPGCRALIRRTAQRVPGPARARDALGTAVCGETGTSGRRMQGRAVRRKLARGGLSEHREGLGPQWHAAEPAGPNNRRLACRAVVWPVRQLGFRGGLTGSR